MHLATLDFEGVLIPEIWINLAEKTGIDALKRTTRDEPDYDKLMRYRLEILDQHGLGMREVESVVAELKPLDGAADFMKWLCGQTRVIILSDTFEEFVRPLLHHLGNPTLFCHSLKIEPSGRIGDYQLRRTDHKRKSVSVFQLLGFDVIATGDSHNDLSMLRSADHACLFRPTDAFASANPDLPVAYDHDALRKFFEPLVS